MNTWPKSGDNLEEPLPLDDKIFFQCMLFKMKLLNVIIDSQN